MTLAPNAESASRQELDSIASIASSLIAREAMKDSAIVMFGSGPRVRIYCLYGEDAITGEDASEQPLTMELTVGDWQLSLPCPKDDLDWVQAALKNKNTRIKARDLTGELYEATEPSEKATVLQINKEAFFRP